MKALHPGKKNTCEVENMEHLQKYALSLSSIFNLRGLDGRESKWNPHTHLPLLVCLTSNHSHLVTGLTGGQPAHHASMSAASSDAVEPAEQQRPRNNKRYQQKGRHNPIDGAWIDFFCLRSSKECFTTSRWWFKIYFLIFTPIWGRFPCWRAYFFKMGGFNYQLV